MEKKKIEKVVEWISTNEKRKKSFQNWFNGKHGSLNVTCPEVRFNPPQIMNFGFCMEVCNILWPGVGELRELNGCPCKVRGEEEVMEVATAISEALEAK